jgi:hypothetical protein
VGSSLTTTSTGVEPDADSFAVAIGTPDARVVRFALRVSF